MRLGEKKGREIESGEAGREKEKQVAGGES